jgi:hypothetical protein
MEDDVQPIPVAAEVPVQVPQPALGAGEWLEDPGI